MSTQGSGGTITSGDINFNNAIKTAAGFLPKINGTTTPFIDTYAAGLGNLAWFNGAGSVANPTNGNNDIMISATYVGHPTGQGALYLDNRMSQNEKTVLGVQ